MRDRSQCDIEFPRRWPHRLAMLLAGVVFPLIWVGGLVTTYDAGMAVPDWPGTYGYNMFLYPLETWLTGPFDLLVEHGHRLLGSTAGIISIALVAAAFVWEPRKAVRWLAAGLLVLVIMQGILGGMRVRNDDRMLAKIHGCVGAAFFASVVGYCVITSRWWWRQRLMNLNNRQLVRRTNRLTQLALLMLVLSYCQLVLGAFLRHIAVDASPTHYKILVIAHVVGAVLLVLGTFTQWVVTGLSRARTSGIRPSIHVLMLLVLMQFLLGLGTWVVKFGWPVWFENQSYAAAFVIGEKSYVQMHLITAHVAVGSLILGTWVVHFLRCHQALDQGTWWSAWSLNDAPAAAISAQDSKSLRPI